MANVPAPGFVDVIRARQPEVGDAVANLFAAAFAPGELPLKIKLLIALGVIAAPCGTGSLATASGVFHEMRGAGFGSL